MAHNVINNHNINFDDNLIDLEISSTIPVNTLILQT